MGCVTWASLNETFSQWGVLNENLTDVIIMKSKLRTLLLRSFLFPSSVHNLPFHDEF